MFLCTVFLSGTVYAQNELRTNADLLHDVIVKSVGQLAGELPGASQVVVSVQFPDYAWFIRHRVIETLSASGFSVAGNKVEADTGYYSIEMGVERFGIRYSDARKRSLFGSRIVTRQAEGVFSFRITGDSSENILRFSETISDVIPVGQRDEVENQALPFTQAGLPGGSMTERYLGPAVIVAATGIVVYLFFSVRS